MTTLVVHVLLTHYLICICNSFSPNCIILSVITLCFFCTFFCWYILQVHIKSSLHNSIFFLMRANMHECVCPTSVLQRVEKISALSFFQSLSGKQSKMSEQQSNYNHLVFFLYALVPSTSRQGLMGWGAEEGGWINLGHTGRITPESFDYSINSFFIDLRSSPAFPSPSF